MEGAYDAEECARGLKNSPRPHADSLDEIGEGKGEVCVHLHFKIITIKAIALMIRHFAC
jgi:hypothetical protein